MHKVKIVAFGNPLLDTVALIEDDSLLKKYNLKPDGQKEVPQNEMKLLKEDLKNYETSVSAGGCAQNTLKVIQWLLQKQPSATIFGAIGNDDDGKLLVKLLNQHGVQTDYIVHNDHPTGVSLALAGGSSRSLVACLGAAEIVTVSHVESITSKLKEADLVYMEGFFLTNRKEATSFILQYCNAHKKVFAFNISGEYLCRGYIDQILEFLSGASIVFGNRGEFDTLASLIEGASLESLISKLRGEGKTVVVTNGAKTILCASSDYYFETEVPVLSREEVVDTTGAGDAFVAGFLTGFILGKPLTVCVKLGCYAARAIIKSKGCTVPEAPPDLANFC